MASLFLFADIFKRNFPIFFGKQVKTFQFFFIEIADFKKLIDFFYCWRKNHEKYLEKYDGKIMKKSRKIDI